jgi:hypothetical protein
VSVPACGVLAPRLLVIVNGGGIGRETSTSLPSDSHGGDSRLKASPSVLQCRKEDFGTIGGPFKNDRARCSRLTCVRAIVIVDDSGIAKTRSRVDGALCNRLLSGNYLDADQAHSVTLSDLLIR